MRKAEKAARGAERAQRELKRSQQQEKLKQALLSKRSAKLEAAQTTLAKRARQRALLRCLVQRSQTSPSEQKPFVWIPENTPIKAVP